MSPLSFLRRCLLGLALFAGTAGVGAEQLAMDWPVVDGDVETARAQLIRQLFVNIGLEGELSVQSTSANIDGQFSDAALVSSVTRITRFKVLEETLSGQTLHMVLEFDRHDEAVTHCVPPLWVRNIEVRIAAPAAGLKMEWREAVQDYLRTLHQTLAQQHPMIIAPRQSVRQAAYLLQLRIAPTGEGGKLQLSVVLRGMDGSAAFEITRELDPAAVRVRQRQALGYADLLTWSLSPQALRQIDEVSAALQKPLRCLPVVLQVHPDEGGALMIEAEQNPAALMPATALFSPVFPLGRDFGLNFLKLSRLLSLVPREAGRFQLLEVKKTASPPTRETDGFVTILH